MEAGKLRNQIAIQAKTATTDSYGGPVESWSTFATVWASIEPLQGRELVNAQSVFAETTVKITMRYLSGVTTAHRITHGGKIYNIQSVLNTEMQNRELVLMASEGLNEG